jgi:hypothetical protein
MVVGCGVEVNGRLLVGVAERTPKGSDESSHGEILQFEGERDDGTTLMRALGSPSSPIYRPDCGR